MHRASFLGIVIASLCGCALQNNAAVELEADSPGKVFAGWRLTQRAFGTINEPWASGGDAEIPDAEETLVYEAVYAQEELPSPRDPGAARLLRVEYLGPVACAVGDIVKATLWVEGPKDRVYVLRIDPAAKGASVHRIENAIPLAGEPGSYLLVSRAKASLTFTSTEAGLAGLRISIDREIVSGAALSRAPEGVRTDLPERAERRP